MRTSYVIVRLADGKAIMETWNTKLCSLVNREKYAVLPILQYLYQLNDAIKENSNKPQNFG